MKKKKYGFSWRKAKKRAKGIGKVLGKGYAMAREYQAQAPQRRKEEITKLKQEIKIAKLRKQKEALQPKEDWGL